TRAPRRISRPWAVNCFNASRAIWMSAIARKRSWASSSTTSLPSRRHTLPSSRPITPAPMTPRRAGTESNSSAPVESTTRSPGTGHPRDRVGPEERRDAGREVANHLLLVRHHRRQIERDARELDAVAGKMRARGGVELRGLEQRLGGDAADVEAGAAEHRLAL